MNKKGCSFRSLTCSIEPRVLAHVESPQKPPAEASGFCGERKATLTEYLEKNVEKLALLRFSFGEVTVAI